MGKYLDMLGDCEASPRHYGMEKKAFPQREVQVIAKDSGHAPPADALISAAPIVPLSTGCQSVYWESMDGTIMGPGQILSVTQDGSEFGICVAYQRYLYWIRDGLLRLGRRSSCRSNGPAAVVTGPTTGPRHIGVISAAPAIRRQPRRGRKSKEVSDDG